MLVTVSNLKQGQAFELVGNLKELPWLKKAFEGLDARVKSFEFSLKLEKKGDFVEVGGSFSGTAELDCVRCLNPISMEIANKIKLFLYSEDGTFVKEPGEKELSEKDLEFGFYSGDRIDLGEFLREQILLILPDYPLCKPDCAGFQRFSKDAVQEDAKNPFYNLKNLKLKK